MNKDDRPRPSHVLLWIIAPIVILVVVGVALSAFFFAMRPISGAYYPFYRPFFFPFDFLFAIFLIFIIFGVLRWVFWGWGWGYRRRYWRHGYGPYYILRERYAKGEITKEQFDQMMRDLQEADSRVRK